MRYFACNNLAKNTILFGKNQIMTICLEYKRDKCLRSGRSEVSIQHDMLTLEASDLTFFGGFTLLPSLGIFSNLSLSFEPWDTWVPDFGYYSDC